MNVYYSSIEYTNPQGSSHIGGFAYGFMHGVDVRDVMPKFIADLEAQKKEIRSVEFIAIYDDIPWDTDEDQKYYDGLAIEASRSGTVVWADFFEYEDEDDREIEESDED